MKILKILLYLYKNHKKLNLSWEQLRQHIHTQKINRNYRQQLNCYNKQRLNKVKLLLANLLKKHKNDFISF